MNEVKLSHDVKMQEWALLIKTCRESGLSVREWCKQNNVSEQTYYYWLKRIRAKIIENSPIQETNNNTQPTFIPIDYTPVKENKISKIIIEKDDIHIEVPVAIHEDLMINIVRALLC